MFKFINRVGFLLCLVVSFYVSADNRGHDFRDPLNASLFAEQIPLEVSANEALKVQGIIITSQRSFAIINGEPVSINGTIEGFDVVGIDIDSVTVSRQGGTERAVIYTDAYRSDLLRLVSEVRQ